MSQNDDPVTPNEMSARFAQLVVMQSQNILFSLGQLGSPGGEAVEPHFDVARVLIDQLEMLKHKTRGNLSAEESTLLDNALSNMRLAFVETVNLTSAQGAAEKDAGKPGDETAPPGAKAEAPAQEATGDEDKGEGDRKRFSKSYG